MEKKILTAISNIQNVLKIWRLRNLTLENKIPKNPVNTGRLKHCNKK